MRVSDATRERERERERVCVCVPFLTPSVNKEWKNRLKSTFFSVCASYFIEFFTSPLFVFTSVVWGMTVCHIKMTFSSFHSIFLSFNYSHVGKNNLARKQKQKRKRIIRIRNGPLSLNKKIEKEKILFCSFGFFLK